MKTLEPRVETLNVELAEARRPRLRAESEYLRAAGDEARDRRRELDAECAVARAPRGFEGRDARSGAARPRRRGAQGASSALETAEKKRLPGGRARGFNEKPAAALGTREVSSCGAAGALRVTHEEQSAALASARSASGRRRGLGGCVQPRGGARDARPSPSDAAPRSGRLASRTPNSDRAPSSGALHNQVQELKGNIRVLPRTAC